jgi:hypothetical protein
MRLGGGIIYIITEMYHPRRPRGLRRACGFVMSQSRNILGLYCSFDRYLLCFYATQQNRFMLTLNGSVGLLFSLQ